MSLMSKKQWVKMNASKHNQQKQDEEAKKRRQKKAKVSAKSKVEEFFFQLNLSIESIKEAQIALEEEIDTAKDDSKKELTLTEALDYITDFQISLEEIGLNSQSVIELMGIKEKTLKNKQPKKCEFLYLKDSMTYRVRPLGVPKKIYKCWRNDPKTSRWHNAIVDDPARFPTIVKDKIRATERYAINVLHYQKDCLLGKYIDSKLKILELPKTLFEEMRSISNQDLKDPDAFSSTKGIMFDVTRTGQGMNTRYNVVKSFIHGLSEKEKKYIKEKKIYDLHQQLPSSIDDEDLKKQLGII